MGQRRACALIVLLIAVCCVPILQAQPAMAQKSVLLGGFAGVSHGDQGEWEDWLSKVQWSSYDDERLSPIGGLSVGYALSDRHVLRLSVERSSVKSRLTSAVTRTTLLDGETETFIVSYNMVAVPVNLSYEFWLHGPARRTAFIGIGGGYYFSQLDGHMKTLDESGGYDETVTRDGDGYGIHLYLGVRAPINDRLTFVTTIRGRYADWMSFTDSSKSVSIEFSGVDVTLGLDAGVW